MRSLFTVMSGTNLKSQKITNYTECAELCDSELDCTGFSITTNNDYCYLKKANSGTPRRTGELRLFRFIQIK